MKKVYKFDPQSITEEVVNAPFKLRYYRLLRKVLVGFILASIVNFFFSFFFYTPKMYNIIKENRDLILKYSILEERVDASLKHIAEIKHRDQTLYRALFGADTIAIEGIYAPYSETKYASFLGDMYEPLMLSAWQRVDALAKLVYLESISFDQLQLLVKDKEKMATSLPAIWPINKRFLRGSIGAFGGRNHPILGRYKMHTGIDLAANKGTPVYATGDGMIAFDAQQRTGYGTQILVEHGFGYKTRYAHLSKIDVVPGQRVLRGEKIGEVGNTGLSTASHLHYEVIYRGAPVNPINYLGKDLTQKDIEEIMQQVKEITYEAQE